uniref:COesterase domain-containing protein n=2 Tax=Caenorhabditis japonica TaxID=281687 RepID=A0A8R1I845_CAEJA
MIFFILLLFSLYSTANSLIISTSLGDLNGDQIGNYHVFKKVPFARPPVGKLRFQKPEAVEKWNGTLDARYYGPACMSNSSVTHSPQKWVDEDCLHLNIFTSEKCLESKDCAVVFYLHGGGIEYDSAVMFNETFLVYVFPKEDVLLVIPAYRLGIFSHFVLEDQSIAPNNLALYDILLALEFVHHEIHHFGGNHRKITLLGHSYGGSIAAMLSFSPRINQDLSLFQRAIIMSSSRDLDTLEAQVNRTMRFVEHANCVPSGTGHQKERDTFIRDCLLDKTGMELLRRTERRLRHERQAAGISDKRKVLINLARAKNSRHFTYNFESIFQISAAHYSDSKDWCSNSESGNKTMTLLVDDQLEKFARRRKATAIGTIFRTDHKPIPALIIVKCDGTKVTKDGRNKVQYGKSPKATISKWKA